MQYDMKLQSYPLPENIRQAVDTGYLDLAEYGMKRYLDDPRTPEVLKQRLRLELYMMRRRMENYPYRMDEAEQLLAVNYQKYKKGMLSDFIAEGLIDYCYLNGIIMVEKKVVENAGKRCKVLIEPDADADADRLLRGRMIKYMRLTGKAEVRVTIEERLTVNDNDYIGHEIFVNLPLPREVAGVQTNIEILDTSENIAGIDDVKAPMRTAQFRDKLEMLSEFRVRFSYTLRATNNKVRKAKEEKSDKEFLKEELPHIAFTPYLQALAAEITAGKRGSTEKAKAIYHFITERVTYSFMREYATIDNVSEYAAVNLKGDCGVQAMLFITLCRICGIPARWQSGWYVTRDRVGNHDWAEFKIGKLWYPVDCSFGGGCFRNGDKEGQEHYFGSLDPFRMIANGACCLPLTGKQAPACDPTDNQMGEAECEGRMIPHSALTLERNILDFIFLR